MVLVGLVAAACTSASGGAGPTGPTPVGSGTAAAVALADQIQGTFIGQVQNPSTSIANYQIVVTRIDDTTVTVSPASGSSSSTFVATLESTVSGSVTSTALKAPADILENNGTFVPATGQLSYAYHLGGGDAGDVEVFAGTKQ